MTNASRSSPETETEDATSAGHPSRGVLLALGICVVFLLVAAYLGSIHEVGDWSVETDFYGSYAPMAEQLSSGGAYTYRHNPPGYTLLLTGVYWLVGDTFVAGKILTVCASVLFLWLTFSLTRSLTEERVALATMLLVAAALLPFSYLAATDVVAATVILGALTLMFAEERPPMARFLAAGLVAGAAYLIRSNAIFLVPAAVLALFGWKASRTADGRGGRRYRAKLLGLFALGFGIVATPWWLYSWANYGSPFATTAHLQVAAHFFASTGDFYGTSLRLQAERFSSVFEVLAADPVHVATTYAKDVLVHYPKRLATEVLGFPAYLFAGAGLVLLVVDGSRRMWGVLGAMAVGYALLGLVGFYPRYHVFLFPVLFLPVAYFLLHPSLRERLARRRLPAAATAWILCLLVVGFLGQDRARDSLSRIADDPRYLRDLAADVRRRAEPGDTMIARKPHLPYLSGLERVFPLEESAEGFLDAAREMGARFLVYSDHEARRWPGLASIENPEELPPEVEVIARHPPTNTIVYEITR